MIKTLKKAKKKLGLDRNYFNIIKDIYEKPTGNNGQRRAFPQRSGTRQWCPLLPFLFNTVLKVVASAIKKEKEIKGIQARKEKVKYVCKRYDLIYRKL